MRLKKLRIEVRDGKTIYIPIAGGQRGADIYLAQIEVPTARKKEPLYRKEVEGMLELYIPSKS